MARDRLLDAAETCLQGKGLSGTTMEDIARQAGVSRATVSYVLNEHNTSVRISDGRFVEVGERGSREKRPYAITEAGKEAFSTWLHQDPGDDVIRMQGLLKVFFGVRIDPATRKRFATLQRLELELTPREG